MEIFRNTSLNLNTRKSARDATEKSMYPSYARFKEHFSFLSFSIYSFKIPISSTNRSKGFEIL